MEVAINAMVECVSVPNPPTIVIVKTRCIEIPRWSEQLRSEQPAELEQLFRELRLIIPYANCVTLPPHDFAAMASPTESISEIDSSFFLLLQITNSLVVNSTVRESDADVSMG